MALSYVDKISFLYDKAARERLLFIPPAVIPLSDDTKDREHLVIAHSGAYLWYVTYAPTSPPSLMRSVFNSSVSSEAPGALQGWFNKASGDFTFGSQKDYRGEELERVRSAFLDHIDRTYAYHAGL